MTNREFLSYISLTACAPDYDSWFVLAFSNRNFIKNRSCPELKAIVDKVHRHVYGHASFKDLFILLERNNLWNEAAEEYVYNVNFFNEQGFQ